MYIAAQRIMDMPEPPVDLAQLHLFTDGDIAEERTLFCLFLDQAWQMIAVLEQSTGEAARETWKAAAHRFSGASANLGAQRLHEACMRAEMLAEAREVEKLWLLESIKAETRHVAAFINQ